MKSCQSSVAVSPNPRRLILKSCRIFFGGGGEGKLSICAGIKANGQMEEEERRRRRDMEVDQSIVAGEVWVLWTFGVFQRELEVNVHEWRTQQITPPPLGTR